MKAFGPILVTGASTGIGRTVTEFLSSRGYSVFAGARKEDDLASLSQLPNLTTMRLDVTSPEDIQRAVDRLRSEGKGVYGLVNNAGVADYRPLVDSSVEELYRVFNVNLYGIHRMTRALVPFLIESHGRVVNISSISGFLTPRFFGAYSISKHAVEAYSDTLREELNQFGVKVSAVEPGNFRSNITANFLPFLKKDELLSQSRYREELTKDMSVIESPEESYGTKYPTPERVAEAVLHALFSENPKSRYLVGNKEEAVWVIEKIMSTLQQVNHDHEHSLSRQEIIEMLGAYLADERPQS
ncbi:MAG TPA: SDR family oxidoreductase [Methylomirabilota bacterium]|nr:SDR family oxidoreductase [Methylomirabilota bacterium]